MVQSSSDAEEEIDDVGDEDEDDEEEESNDGTSSEVERLQAECSAMVKLLVKLEKEEHQLTCQLEILAREALLCGFIPDVVEPAAPKRRRTSQKSEKVSITVAIAVAKAAPYRP